MQWSKWCVIWWMLWQWSWGRLDLWDEEFSFFLWVKNLDRWCIFYNQWGLWLYHLWTHYTQCNNHIRGQTKNQSNCLEFHLWTLIALTVHHFKILCAWPPAWIHKGHLICFILQQRVWLDWRKGNLWVVSYLPPLARRLQSWKVVYILIPVC